MLNDYLKTLPQYLLPKSSLTFLVGLLAKVKSPIIKNNFIRGFIKHYGVNMKEALEENPVNFACFNDFFIRHLKPECRPLAKAQIVSPVDGSISEIGTIKEGQILQAKGRYYTVDELVSLDPDESELFKQGHFATLYLSPRDYHRIHMPIDAQLKSMTYLPGKLFSVQPSTARVIPRLFARNERLVCLFETEAGPMVMIFVGATIVGAIGTRWFGEIKRSKQRRVLDLSSLSAADKKIKKGEEVGYFKLGSTVILLFANKQKVSWMNELQAGSSIQYGQAMGMIVD